ncbi:hypothetical protein MPC4_160043 [Methylocella tundrae]|uniref:Uncharacterized protein n=1 Tax=Methylocella tundrae TaxID=227605 RepID=A0A8B6M4W0_METTU|nr:hypothetical protein MPC4_160043 [Methylocella tundrae]
MSSYEPMLLLLGDDLALDLGVDGGRDDLFLHQLVLALVGPVLDDVGGAFVAYAGQGLKVRLARRIDVEQRGGSRSRLRHG